MDAPRSSTPRPNRPKLPLTSDGVVKGAAHLYYCVNGCFIPQLSGEAMLRDFRLRDEAASKSDEYASSAPDQHPLYSGTEPDH
jgi:hypothetical protein